MNKRNNEKKSSAPEELAVLNIQNSDDFFGRLISGCLDCKQGNTGNSGILL